MPGVRDDSATRLRLPSAATLYVPVVVSLLVQVVPTAAVSAWLGEGTGWGPLKTMLAVASALCLLGARRFPGPTVAAVSLLVAAGFFTPPDAGPPAVAVAFAIVGAIVRNARMWALVSVGTCWLGALTLSSLIGTSWHPFRVALLTLALIVCFAAGEGLRTRRDRIVQRRADLMRHRESSEQRERARIAAELHDVLAHSLSQISVQSGIGLHLFERDPERVRTALASIRALSATGLHEVRGVLAFLRGDDAGHPGALPLSPQPQLADISALARQRTGLGLAVSLDDDLQGDLPPSAVQTTAYRIVQEALTNVLRHSAATIATVSLQRNRGQLVVAVEDNGVGPTGTPEGAGMRGMRDRASLMDGTLAVESSSTTTGSGTRIVARLPWAGPA